MPRMLVARRAKRGREIMQKRLKNLAQFFGSVEQSQETPNFVGSRDGVVGLFCYRLPHWGCDALTRPTQSQRLRMPLFFATQNELSPIGSSRPAPLVVDNLGASQKIRGLEGTGGDWKGHLFLAQFIYSRAQVCGQFLSDNFPPKNTIKQNKQKAKHGTNKHREKRS